MINNISTIFSDYTPYINGWEKFKRASVTIPLVEIDNNTHILFQVRSNNLKTNPNEICFPGGKIEKHESPVNAATRETCEELGLFYDDIHIISPLDLFVSPFNILIHPFLVEITNYDKININKDEVEKVFLVPLDHFLNTEPEIYSNRLNIIPNEQFPYDIIQNKSNYKFSTGNYDILFYTYGEYVIWGMTAKILENFISKLKTKH